MTDDIIDDGDDWGPICSADTTAEELEAIIERQIARCVRIMRDDLAADPDYTDRERAYILARSTPIIQAKTRAAIITGWECLRAEAAGGSAHLH